MTGGYQDIHFVFRSIKAYSTTRLIDRANAIQDFDGNINEHIPLTPNLRQEYGDMMSYMGPPIPKFMNWEMDGVGVLFGSCLLVIPGYR